jgi:ubiquinone/menaquinone biosynthesis C-methylase UbiE
MKSWKFNRVSEQLRVCKIKGGVWIDAGCGTGTYTIPLATLASRVIALDKNSRDIELLKKQMSGQTNIKPMLLDFNRYSFNEKVDGILFAFSLHYTKDPKKALTNAFNHIKKGGRILIIEYSRKKPVSWVPFPQQKEKLINVLVNIGFRNIKILQELGPSRKTYFWDNASYILEGQKILDVP